MRHRSIRQTHSRGNTRLHRPHNRGQDPPLRTRGSSAWSLCFRTASRPARDRSDTPQGPRSSPRRTHSCVYNIHRQPFPHRQHRPTARRGRHRGNNPQAPHRASRRIQGSYWKDRARRQAPPRRKPSNQSGSIYERCPPPNSNAWSESHIDLFLSRTPRAWSESYLVLLF